jgi:hypothetical protein
MNKRTLKSGVEIVELSSPIELSVYTKVPHKYILLDMETGEKYLGNVDQNGQSWIKIEGNK